MKRTMSILLAALLTLSLTACGGGGSGNGDSSAASTASGGENGFFFTGQSQESAPGAPAESEDASAQPGQNAKLIRRAERAWEGLRRSTRPSDATRLAETEQALDGLRKMKEEWQSWQP